MYYVAIVLKGGKGGKGEEEKKEIKGGGREGVRIEIEEVKGT